MKFELFPQSVRIYPSDRQTFEARATSPPPLWIPLTNLSPGFVLPDASVRHAWRSPLSTSVLAYGAFRLMRGIGSIEFTIRDANCLPSGGAFIWAAQFKGPAGSPTFGQYLYTVEIHDDDVTIKIEGGSTLATILRTAVIGDKFKIELNSGFRLYINDVLQNERVGLADIQYPAAYRAQVNTTIIGTDPTIPAPQLDGAWELSPTNPLASSLPTVKYTAPSHGSLSAANSLNGLTTDYFNGTVPGQHKLVAVIDPGVDVWVEDAAPAGSTVTSTGGSWVWGTGSPAHFSGSQRLKSPLAAGDHQYRFATATDTLPINKDDVLTCYVFLDQTNPPTEIMLQWEATDSTGLAHRAYWGANSLPHGVDGTPSRRFMGALPATNQWVKLEVPASLVDMEGRVANGGIFSLFDGVCSFDQFGKSPGLVQRAESLITILPLEILGELTRTIQPGTKARLQVNYDDAQTPNLVTWSIVSGGGSISGNEFTAPSSPGTTVVRATSGNQLADMTINVPAIVTPGYTFVAPLEQIDWDTNIPATVTWSSIPSGINSSTGVITFPDTPGAKVRIQATNGTFTAIRDVLIVPAFPFTDFSLPLSWDRNLSALISMSEDRSSRITRDKAPPFDSYPVKLLSRTLADCNTIDAFFDAQGFGKPFILEDKVRGIRKAGWFDSPIRHEARDECDIDLSFQFLEARL